MRRTGGTRLTGARAAATEGGGAARWLVWGGVLLMGVLVAVLAFHALSPHGADADVEEAEGIGHENEHNHVHGIGFDAAGDRLFVATHYGLFRLDGATGDSPRLLQVGDLRDDLMGFSLDPHHGDRMFASGHPAKREPGGPVNTGVARSVDGGFTWQRLWDGPGGQAADFHAMAISPVNADRLAGYFAGTLFVSLDAGGTWQQEQSPAGSLICWNAPCLSWDLHEPGKLWLGNGTGLFTSFDMAGTWDPVREGAHGAVMAHPADGAVWAWNVTEGVLVSRDDGIGWNAPGDPLGGTGGDVFAFSGAADDPDVVFAAMRDGQHVYRTLDGGVRWERVLPLSG